MVGCKGGINPVTSNKHNARIFKALSDANRLTVLALLRNGEKCACHLLEELKISQPTLSHHMRILCDSGIVKSRKEGKWSYYSFNSEGVETAKKLLDTITKQNIVK